MYDVAEAVAVALVAGGLIGLKLGGQLETRNRRERSDS